MSSCPFCGTQYPGLAAVCPHCGKDLPPAGLVEVTPTTVRRGRAPLVIGISVGLASGLAALIILGYIDFLLNFCIDFSLFGDDGVDQCAEENRRMELLFFFGVVPVSILVGLATGWLTTRGLRRREARRAEPFSPLRGSWPR